MNMKWLYVQPSQMPAKLGFNDVGQLGIPITKRPSEISSVCPNAVIYDKFCVGEIKIEPKSLTLTINDIPIEGFVKEEEIKFKNTVSNLDKLEEYWCAEEGIYKYPCCGCGEETQVYDPEEFDLDEDQHYCGRSPHCCP